MARRGPDSVDDYKICNKLCSIFFVGSVLHIRGSDISLQPAVSSSGNILLFNGEIYDDIKIISSDTDALLNQLEKVDDITNVLQSIKGPFAFVYWQKKYDRFWFGKDIYGRRSLLLKESRDGLVISSFIPRDEPDPKDYQEIKPGIYRLDVLAEGENSYKIFYTPYRTQHPENSFPETAIRPIVPYVHDISTSSYDGIPSTILTTFANLLYKSVGRRILHTLPFLCKNCKGRTNANSGGGLLCEHSKVAVLFSGGLDCMVITYLMNQIMKHDQPIDLLNVAFHENEYDEPSSRDKIKDRHNALMGVRKLSQTEPRRVWNFVQIDVTRSALESSSASDICHLLQPGSDAILDNSIGPAFWFAARGRGKMTRYVNGQIEGEAAIDYDSSAQILFSGFGADELLAGYVRHRKVFNLRGEEGLLTELETEWEKIYHRNLGRDDRIVSSHGKEVRYPYLDEDLVTFLKSLPLNYKANLNLPPGTGDKMLLRVLAKLWGLDEASALPKKAIQFGSNIAKINKIVHHK